MAQLLIALEKGTEPAISGRDNLNTMALVEAAYLSAAEFRAIEVDTIRRAKHPQGQSRTTSPVRAGGPQGVGPKLGFREIGRRLPVTVCLAPVGCLIVRLLH